MSPVCARHHFPAALVAAGPMAALVGLLSCGSMGRPAAASADQVAPMGHGARKYFAPAAPEGAVDMLSDPLARSLCDLVRKTAGAQGQDAPRPDGRLGAVAETLAETLGPDEVPGLELQEFLLSHFGLGDPLPELSMFQVGMDDDTIRSKFAARIPGLLREGPFGRVGVGVVRRFFGKTSVVLALQRTDIELLPVPRRLAAGESAFIAGRLLLHRWDPRVLVAPPHGEVETLDVRGNAAGFQTQVRCDSGPGRYQVEIVGTGLDGKSVVANFPVFCAIEPPTSAPHTILGGLETTDRQRAETLATEAVNHDRTAAGLPALQWDPALARAARSYSDELARRQVVEHTSRESGDAADRVRKVGARALVVYENVGRANSIADAERSFMSSPGHRANILARPAQRIGVGVTIRQDPGAVPLLYITQLFAR